MQYHHAKAQGIQFCAEKQMLKITELHISQQKQSDHALVLMD